MYVDKKLMGVHAVQTLSRLNRTHPGKTDTFVLDFVNEPELIQEAFQPYYEKTLVGEQVEPRQLYELQSKLDNQQVYYKAEVEEFARVFYAPGKVQTKADHAKLYKIIDPAVERYKELDEDEREEFRKTLTAFRNLYAFMSQILPFYDTDLEKLYSYARFLIYRLPKREFGPAYHFDDEVSLHSYRLEKQSEGAIKLEKKGGDEVAGAPTEVGTGKSHEETIELSRLIDLLNQRFGTDFKPGDQLFFDSIIEDAIADTHLQKVARANTMENFGFVFLKELEGFFIDRMEQNEEIAARYMNEIDFRSMVGEAMLRKVYDSIMGNV
jgi:type I restriction enzyme R subunit